VSTLRKNKLEKWKESSDDSLKIKYNKQLNKASKVVRLAKRVFERKITKNIKKRLRLSLNMHDPRKELNQHSTVGPLIDDNDVLTCDDQEMGQM